MKRRLYALLLAVCMTVTAMPQMTLAANSNVGGYIDVPFDLPEVNIPDEEGIPAQKNAAVPPAYDGRKKIGAVRDQNPYGTCWAFAAMAAAEAGMVSGKIADTAIDLSEYQLARFFYNNVNDPLGNTAGDKTIGKNRNTGMDIADDGSYLKLGGNNMFTTWAMAGWKAGAAESVAPYASIRSTTPIGKLPDSVAFNNVAHMQNAYWIPLSVEASNQQLVKKMIMEYGAVATAYMHEDRYYRQDTCAYYVQEDMSINHAVSIVGWDDNFGRDKFNSGSQPVNNGAWLVRNSWGSSWGDKGYFWISYEDASLDDMAFVFEFEKADNYKYNYQYDGSCGVRAAGWSGNFSVANVFKVFGNQCQSLDAVSVGMYYPGTAYSIQIYRNPEKGNPSGGTPMLQTPQTGTTTYTGYHTIKLNNPVVLRPGDTFAVEITLPEGGAVFRDESYSNGNWIRFESAVSPNQSYEKVNNRWQDFAEENSCARIKAFTNDYNGNAEYTTEIVKANADKGTDGRISYRLNGAEYSFETIYAPSKLKLSWDTLVYNGQIQKPSVSVYDRNAKLIAASEYTVNYGNNNSKEPGDYKVTVTFRGDRYTGTLKGTYTIKEGVYTTKISKADAGKKKNGKTTYLLNGKEYKSETIYAPSKLKFSKDTLSYTGKAQKPSVSVYDTKGKKISSANYTVSYSNSKSVLPGTYSVTVKFKGSRYTGSLKKSYKIAVGSAGSFKASPKSETSIKLLWKKQKNADGYYLYAAASEKGKYKKIAELKKNSNVSYTYSKLKSGKTYYFKIQAYKKIGNKTYKSGYSTAVTASKPETVKGLKASLVKKASLKLSWKKVSGADRYEVYRYDSAKKKYLKIAEVQKNSYTDKALKGNKTYKYKVRACHKAGKSAVAGGYSSIKSVKTKKS